MATQVNPPTIKSSPWGWPQHQMNYAPGVDVVDTASHGGFRLDRKQNARIPDAFRLPDGWYEEDCDAAIPVYFLNLPDFTPDRKSAAEKTLKVWKWQEWEQHTGQPLPPGVSFLKDRESNRQTA